MPSHHPTFNRDDGSGATGYTIKISKNAAFTNIVVIATVTVSTYTSLVNLPANIPLYWRVRATGPNGPSLWSATWSFTISP